MKRSADLIPPALILLAAVLAYHGSFSIPFFFDDVVAVRNNSTIRNLWSLADVLSPPTDGGGVTGRPIVNLSLALNFAIGGTEPRSYHAFNLIVHAIAALSLFGLLRRTFGQPILRGRFRGAGSSLAFVIALIWTVHPIQTESVACVIQRTELLVGLFYLLTLYCFVRGADESQSRLWFILVIASCMLGMASKEVMVSAPLVVLLYDRTFIAGTFRAAWQRRRALYLSLAASWLVLIGLLAGIGGTRGDAAGFGLGISWWSYALKQCEAIVTYLRLSFWPHPLIMDYGSEVITDPIRVAPQALIVLLLVVATFAALKARPILGFLMFLFFAILAPSSSVVPLITQTMAEHRMYLPLAAVVSLAVVAGYGIAGIRIVPIAVVAVAALCVATVARNRIMEDEVTLWTDTVARQPANPRARGSLGLALSEQGRAREALVHFKKALELDPASLATEQNIGNVYYRLGDFTAAAAHYRRVVDLDPKFASGYNNIGAALWELRDTDGALQNYRRALELDPHHAGARQNIARALFALNRFSESVVHYEHVQRAHPNSPDAHYDLGLVLARAGDVDRATRHFGEALRLRPNAGSYLNYARFLANAGRTADAIANLEIALRLQPDFTEARRELERLQGRR